ncbi:UNVERIFIED_CONTAM: hypothetical protein GTU68_042405 [Idotea baltica]|nr:hypothetical protein [Idotea baltica]
MAGMRFDAVAARLFADYSRSRLQEWIKRGFLTTDGRNRRTSDKLVGGEEIVLVLPPDAMADTWEETWANDIVHTDEHFYIVNKPVSLVMHPAPGNRTGTLMNGLLHLEPGLRHVPRAGIVHRLDKETSGLCVVARTLKAHAQLVAQLQARTVSREYLAIVIGNVPDAGTVDEPIGRHPKDRKRMAVVRSGKEARTHFSVLERFDDAALVAVKLETGRTHQIRVHMTHLGFPLLGDPVYSKRSSDHQINKLDNQELSSFSRQALHAQRLGLVHPNDQRDCEYSVQPPADFNHVLQILRADAANKV